MIRAVLLVALLAALDASAAPVFVVEDGLAPKHEIQSAAERAWDALGRLYVSSTGTKPKETLRTLRLRFDGNLSPGHAGGARPGLIGLRQLRENHFDERLSMALRHELTHQFLWSTCAASSEDRLFHEAFALVSSGEMEEWGPGEEGYLSLPNAVARLQQSPSLDAPSARRALARILMETSTGKTLPPALASRLKKCADGASWGAPLSVEELVSGGVVEAAAFIVLSRHSGEVLVAEGAVSQPMPYASTLKPFVVAGALERSISPPSLRPRESAEWSCGEGLSSRVDASTALVRSCNGWFLDWGTKNPSVSSLGGFGEALVALGLGRRPVDMAEAIGLRSTLTLSPRALAEAYRLLGESRPELLKTLRATALSGTLSGLSESKALAGMAVKTGTVRDADSRPRLGWIVAVDEDRVAVMVRPGQAPRKFAGEFLKALKAQKEQARVAVQVFGLLDQSRVELRCEGRPYAVGARLERLGSGWLPLTSSLRKGRLLCSGGAWRVRFPGEAGREYAGVFSHDPAPPYRPAPGERVGGPQLRARRGSDVVFSTTLSRYAAGVVHAEDASLAGPPREALMRVVAHNVHHSRHGGRPVCDTTHCQTFLGTRQATAAERSWVRKPVAGQKGWLSFSQGGEEQWEERRPRDRLLGLFGAEASGITFGSGQVRWLESRREGVYSFEEPRSAPCESVRSPLKLPSCPSSMRIEDGMLVFTGSGRGHGEGLDVEAAKTSGTSADEILRRAYSPMR